MYSPGGEYICSRCSLSPAPPPLSPILPSYHRYPSSPSPTPLVEYDPIDYKKLFEQEKEEKEVVSQRYQELEGRQQILENSLAKFLDLRRELRDLNAQAEEADTLIDSIIQEAVPDFGVKRRKDSSDEDEDTYNASRNRIKLLRGGRMDLRNLENLSPNPFRNAEAPLQPLYRATPAQADPEMSVAAPLPSHASSG